MNIFFAYHFKLVRFLALAEFNFGRLVVLPGIVEGPS